MTNFTWGTTSGPVELLELANQFTDNWFWSIVIVIFWFILFSYLSNRYEGKSLSITFFLTGIMAILLNWLGLVSFVTVGICIAGFVLCLFL